MKVSVNRNAVGPQIASVGPLVSAPGVSTTSLHGNSIRRNPRLVTIANLALWLTVLGIHAACSFYYAIVALVYHKLPATVLSTYVWSYRLAMDMSSFSLVVAFHAVCVALHVAFLLEMLVMSARRRKLYFHRWTERSLVKTRSSSSPVERVFTSSRRLSALQSMTGSLRSAGKTASSTWESTFGVTGVFGVGSKHFALLFLIRELTEVVLQSVQAHQLSEYVPRVWLNRLAAVVVAISCWSTPAIRRLLSKSPRLELILCLLFDVALDFVSSIAVPGVLVLQYLPAYDPATTDFAYANWNDSVWCANMNTELKQVFTQSWFDLLSRALFALTLLLCLDDVKMLAAASESVISRLRLGNSQSSAAKWSHRFEKLVHAGLIIWGFVILGLHIDSARNNEVVSDCLVQVRPWRATQIACTYVNIDCQKHPGMVGNADELEAVWADLDKRYLSMLAIHNCPELHMAAGIQTLRQLAAISVFSSNIVEWSESAALSTKFHPNLRQITLRRANISASLIGTVVFIFTGLTGLPSDLDEIWPPGLNLLLTVAGLTTVPEVLLRMHIARLNVQANQIQQISAELFEIPTLKWLQIGQNPISEFPEDVPHPGASLFEIDFMSTNVSSLPAWMATPSSQNRVNVKGPLTPFCSQLQARSDELATRYCSGAY